MKPGSAYSDVMKKVESAGKILKAPGSLTSLTQACGYLREARSDAEFMNEKTANPYSDTAKKEYESVLNVLDKLEKRVLGYATVLAFNTVGRLEKQVRGVRHAVDSQIAEVRRLKAGRSIPENKVTNVYVRVVMASEKAGEGAKYVKDATRVLNDHGIQNAETTREMNSYVSKLDGLRTSLEELGKTQKKMTRRPEL